MKKGYKFSEKVIEQRTINFKKNKIYVVKEHRCVICNKIFYTGIKNQSKKTCSPKCRKDLRRVQRLGRTFVSRPKTQEWKDKIGKGNKGKIRTPDQILNLSVSHLGIRRTPESLEKAKATVSDEVYKICLKTTKGRIRPKEEIENIRQTCLRKRLRPKTGKQYFIQMLKHIIRSRTLELPFFIKLFDNKIPYLYEDPIELLLSSGRKSTYYVDCKLLGTNVRVECKGPRKNEIINGKSICGIDDTSREKMKCFREQYPNQKLWVVTYKALIKNFPKECYDEIFSIEEDLDELVSLIPLLKVA